MGNSKMKCCIECFKDSEIRAIIRTANQQGTCDFCSHTHTYVYDTAPHLYLS